MTRTEAKPEHKPKHNLYVRALLGEMALFKWTWVKTQKLCKPEREDYRDRPGAPEDYKAVAESLLDSQWRGIPNMDWS